MGRFLALLAAGGLVLVALSGASPAQAATITVDSLADNTTVDGDCTLREAIGNANDDATTHPDCAPGAGPDVIDFSVAGTILLGAQLDITETLEIDGSGGITIDGQDAVRLIGASTSGVDLTLKNLVLQNGRAGIGPVVDGGDGHITVMDSTVQGNESTASDGGIETDIGDITVYRSMFSDNVSGSTGGALESSTGTIAVYHSTFTNNTAANSGGVMRRLRAR